MEHYSTLDRGIILAWILLLFLGSVTAAVGVFDALTDATYFRYQSLRHIFGLSSVTILFGYVFYDLASGLWKGTPDMEMVLLTSSLLGKMALLGGLVTLIMITVFGMEGGPDFYYFIPGCFMIGAFGVLTRRKFRNHPGIKKDPTIQ
jgi:hypothetical protein